MATANVNNTTDGDMLANLNARLFRLESRMAMLATVEGFTAFQQLEKAQQFAMLCDQAESLNQCRELADAIELT